MTSDNKFERKGLSGKLLQVLLLAHLQINSTNDDKKYSLRSAADTYQGIAANEGVLQVEGLVQSFSLGLLQFRRVHFDDETDTDIGVVLAIIGDRGRYLLGAHHHRFQYRVFVVLRGGKMEA